MFSRFRSLPIATSASRRPLPTDNSRLLQCDSSVVQRHPNRSRKRRVRRCSPTLPKASVGTASGRLMRTTFAARRTRATWRGSVLPMMSRLPRSPARGCLPSDLPRARDRACRSSSRGRRMAAACSWGAPGDHRDDQRTLNECLRGAARVARCAARLRAGRPRRASRSWRRGADRRRRRRGRG